MEGSDALVGDVMLVDSIEEVVDKVKGHVLAIGNPWIVVERVRKGEQKPMMGMLNLGEAEAVGVAVRILRRVYFTAKVVSK